MNLYKLYKTNEVLERSGRWFDYGDAGTRFLIAHIRRNGSSYSKLLDARLKPYRYQIQTDTMDEGLREEIIRDVFAEKGLLGWENVTDESGRELQYTPENARKLLTDLPELYEELAKLAITFTNFREHEIEVDIKN